MLYFKFPVYKTQELHQLTEGKSASPLSYAGV